MLETYLYLKNKIAYFIFEDKENQKRKEAPKLQMPAPKRPLSLDELSALRSEEIRKAYVSRRATKKRR